MIDMDYDSKLLAEISGRLERVKEEINEAVISAGRKPEEVTLIGVSKVFPVEYAEAAFNCGLKDLGEHRVQELVPKIERFNELGLEANWHLIGTLQTNKVKDIIGKTKLVHSVNTLNLAAEISKRSVNNNIITDILIQANISGEESKHGFAESELKSAIEEMSSMDGIRLRGLMTMAPIQSYEGEAQKVFERTYKVYEELKSELKDPSVWNVLSMGMSQDYKYAIKEGATHIRIGTAIFGDRNAYLN